MKLPLVLEDCGTVREIARNRGRSYYVKCHVCGFEGKHRESGSRAVASWNEGAMEGKE